MSECSIVNGLFKCSIWCRANQSQGRDRRMEVIVKVKYQRSNRPYNKHISVVTPSSSALQNLQGRNSVLRTRLRTWRRL